MIRALEFLDLFELLRAAGLTLMMAALALAGSAILAVVVAVLRMSPVRPVRWLAVGYIQLVQGTPLLVWLFLLFFGVAALGWSVNAWISGTIAFSIYGGAFLGEIWFGALAAVPRTQWEAGASLGLSFRQQLTNVVLPQSVRIAIPPTIGFAVQLIKNTSLASTIGLYELTLAGMFVAAATYKPLIVYPLVAAIYFALCFPLTLWSRSLERRFSDPR